MADGTQGPITDAQVLLRRLPSVQSLLEHPSAAHALHSLGHETLTRALRHELAQLRTAILAGRAGQLPDATWVVARRGPLRAASTAALRRVINATGIVVHTNLGRAPLAEVAAAAAAEAARAACNLEFDLQTGRRGSRGVGAEALLCRLTGAEAALAVNNNAAAMLLALAALAGPGAEVVVSRGELVEIGGGFRIPDIITQGGARLVEVGTTNRTRLARLRGRHHAADAPAAEGAPEQLPHGGLHRRGQPGRAGRPGPRARACSCWTTSAAARWRICPAISPSSNPRCARASTPAPTWSPLAATSCSAARNAACSSATPN